MKYVIDFFTNYMIVCAMSGWMMAQILKVFTGIFRMKKFSFIELLFGTGGMPSSHTAAVIGLTTAAVIKYGLGSSQFAICGVLSMIVMRDAMGMRRQVGEHAKALNIIIKELADAKKDPKLTEKALGELAGHTPLQVWVGAIVGALTAIALMFIPTFGIV
jgi:acid phosphatase family membrane protein YuiD